MIQIHQLNKYLGTKEVLSDITWQLDHGKVYGLVGPNGAGKSTLLRLLAGIYQPDQGSILLDDQPIYENAFNKQRIAFVSDDPFFLHRATISQLADFYRIHYPSFREDIYQKLIFEFRLDPHQRINTFSKGMKRQAAIIVAISIGADYLLLDEAFDGLDPVMRLTLKQIISDEIINRNLTVIISSHNIRELEDIADEIALIQNGKLNICASIDTLRDTYHKYQLAFKEEVPVGCFAKLDTIYMNCSQKFITLIIKGDASVLTRQLYKTEPLLLEELPISMEEIMVYEMKENGYGK